MVGERKPAHTGTSWQCIREDGWFFSIYDLEADSTFACYCFKKENYESFDNVIVSILTKAYELVSSHWHSCRHVYIVILYVLLNSLSKYCLCCDHVMVFWYTNVNLRVSSSFQTLPSVNMSDIKDSQPSSKNPVMYLFIVQLVYTL